MSAAVARSDSRPSCCWRAATAAAGPIAFLGLVVPHLARTITGPDHRWLIPYSGLFGALLLLIADVAGRVVARPGELEVGVVVAVLGVPFFLAFVRRRKLVNL
nr:iron chelate uptake ABC transporter family permease subunit [Nocardia beijingensis]